MHKMNEECKKEKTTSSGNVIISQHKAGIDKANSYPEGETVFDKKKHQLNPVHRR